MKQFTKNIFLFFLPIITVIFVCLTFLIYMNSQTNEVTLESNINNIYVGDSHIQLAIDDNMISNSLNVAKTSESFYFSYYKLKMLTNNNSSIDTVYLGLSYHSLSSYYDEFIEGKHSSAVSPKYFYLLPLSEQFKMLNLNSNKLLPFFTSITKIGINSLINNESHPYIGSFRSRFEDTKAVKASMDKRLILQYHTDKGLKPFSKLNIHYLNKIIEICKSKGIVLITLNTPLHEYYYKKVPVEYKNKLLDIIKSNKLNYINLSNLNLNDDCFIPDGDHVSKIGATQTTLKLKEIIKHERTTSAISNWGLSD